MSDTRVATRPYIIGPAATHFVVPAGGGPSVPTIDGIPVSDIQSTVVTFPLTFSTTKINDLCIIYFMVNVPGVVSGVASTTLGAWTFRNRSFASAPNIVEYCALAPGILTNEIVTVTVTGTPTVSGVVFAVNGCDISSVAAAYDGAGSVDFTGTPAGKSTTSAATMAICGFRGNGDGAVASGWTNPGGNRAALFMITEYQTFTSPQSGTVNCPDTMTGVNGWIYDPVKSAGQ